MDPILTDEMRDHEAIIREHADMVRRICFLYLQNSSEADDVFQDVFLKLFQNKTPFANPEHEKAWLIRVAINACKDVRKSFRWRRIHLIQEFEFPAVEANDIRDDSESEILQVVLSLPKKFKELIYLFYYEDYSVPQIAAMLGKKENTIYSQLHRARGLIRKKLRGEENERSI
jgi:RNA polymerase sigma-70 factor (ECF subfamily)